MEKYVFDNEKFISLVESNTCLWNTADENYTDRGKKQQCWIQIAKEMEPEFQKLTSTKQKEYAKDFQRKWKSLRNSFARELAKRRKMKIGSEPTWKTYVFFEKLSFLLGCPTHKETGQNDSDEYHEPQVSILDDDTAITERKKIKLSSERDSSDIKITELLKESLNQLNANEKLLEQDDDRHFLLSLLGDLKRVPVKRKIDVKLAIMQTIKEAIVSTPSAFSSHNTPL